MCFCRQISSIWRSLVDTSRYTDISVIEWEIPDWAEIRLSDKPAPRCSAYETVTLQTTNTSQPTSEYLMFIIYLCKLSEIYPFSLNLYCIAYATSDNVSSWSGRHEWSEIVDFMLIYCIQIPHTSFILAYAYFQIIIVMRSYYKRWCSNRRKISSFSLPTAQ